MIRFLAVLCLTTSPLARAAAETCPDKGVQEARVADVEARLELRLADGRLLRLAGIDPAGSTPEQPDLGETEVATLDAGLKGKAIRVHLLSDRADRWGRLPAFVFREGDGPGGLAARLIAAGAARYLAEPGAAACRDLFLTAETKARGEKLGLWRDPYYAVLGVDDGAAFRERAGTIVVAEAVLASVDTSAFRTTLRFAAPKHVSGRKPFGGRMLVATISPRVMKVFAAQSRKLDTLVGTRLRLRGLLDLRFGPHLVLDGPDSIESLTETTADPTR